MFNTGTVFLAIVSLGLGMDTHFGFLADQWLLRKYWPVGKIVGGTDAEIGEFPYQVAIRTRGKVVSIICGGSILSENIILTAAHCIKRMLLPPDVQLEVVAGKYETFKDGPNVQISRIKKEIPHPKYPGYTDPYDIAILILEKPFKFNKFVQPVALPEKGATFTGNTTLSGWGSVSTGGQPINPVNLQKVELPLIDFETCKKKMEGSNLNEMSNICTGPIGDKLSACKGDSGGPLTKDVNGVKTVIGIVSWGMFPCGHGYPSVYTRVSSFIDFIETSAGKFLPN